MRPNGMRHRRRLGFRWRRAAKALLPPRIQHAYRIFRHVVLLPYERELRFVSSMLSQHRVAIDIGAHVGLYTHVLARGSQRVIAFEPHPTCALYLQNLALKRCAIAALAISDRSGSATLRVPGEHDDENRALSTIHSSNDFKAGVNCSDESVYRVETSTLDDALKGRLLPSDSVGFIKIDVEGHELPVLKGAEATITMHRPMLLIEIESRHGGAIEETFAWLQQHGYAAFALGDDNALSLISAEQLLSLQSSERLLLKKTRPRYFGYVNNIFFVPAEFA